MLGTSTATRNPYSYANQNPLRFVDPSGLVDVNLISASDPAYEPNNQYNNPQYFTFSAHGDPNDPNHAYTQSTNGQPLSVQDVGNAILQSNWDRTQPLQSLICEGMKGGTSSFDAQVAQFLANTIQAPVTMQGSSGDVSAERYRLLGTSFNFGGSDPGPGGWQTITAKPIPTP
jgi:hypothetical protein